MLTLSTWVDFEWGLSLLKFIDWPILIGRRRPAWSPTHNPGVGIRAAWAATICQLRIGNGILTIKPETCRQKVQVFSDLRSFN